jgi:hypothetical protein
VNRLRRALRDPFVVSVSILVTLLAGGLVAVGVAWKTAAASLDVAVQLPYLVSGALGGLAVAGFAAGLLSIQIRRRQEASRRADMARVVTAAAEVLAVARRART